jgi:hypothetical protein
VPPSFGSIESQSVLRRSLEPYTSTEERIEACGVGTYMTIAWVNEKSLTSFRM